MSAVRKKIASDNPHVAMFALQVLHRHIMILKKLYLKKKTPSSNGIIMIIELSSDWKEAVCLRKHDLTLPMTFISDNKERFE